LQNLGHFLQKNKLFCFAAATLCIIIQREVLFFGSLQIRMMTTSGLETLDVFRNCYFTSMIAPLFTPIFFHGMQTQINKTFIYPSLQTI
jgi:hypothetical protein